MDVLAVLDVELLDADQLAVSGVVVFFVSWLLGLHLSGFDVQTLRSPGDLAVPACRDHVLLSNPWYETMPRIVPMVWKGDHRGHVIRQIHRVHTQMPAFGGLVGTRRPRGTDRTAVDWEERKDGEGVL